MEVYCKAWPVREGQRFHKQAFVLDWQRQIIRCPAEQEMPFVLGGVVHFPRQTCEQCPSARPMHYQFEGTQWKSPPDEALLIELRQRQQTDASTGQTA